MQTQQKDEGACLGGGGHLNFDWQSAKQDIASSFAPTLLLNLPFKVCLEFHLFWYEGDIPLESGPTEQSLYE